MKVEFASLSVQTASTIVKVGVPPETVTVLLNPRVSVVVAPGWRIPLAGDSTTEVMFAGTASISGPVWVRPLSERLALLPPLSVIVAPLRLTAVAARLEVASPDETV